MQRAHLVLGLMGLLLLSSGSVLAQNDPFGNMDTVIMVPSVVPEEGVSDQLQLNLYVYSDETLLGATAGFTWDNPKLQMDSAVGSALLQSSFDLGLFFYQDSDLGLTNANQQFLFGGASLFSSLTGDASSRRLWASYFFTATGWTASDAATIDTLTFNNGSEWLFSSSGGEVRPYWAGAVTIGAPPQNEPPVLDPVADQETTESILLEFGVSATDPDGTLPIMSTGPLPAGAIFTDLGDGSGLFSWVPTFNQAGVYDVRFYASDSEDAGLMDSQDVVITVIDSNRVPVLTIVPQTTEVLEGELLTFDVSATDPDGTTPVLTAYIDGEASLAPNMTFVDNGDGTGQLTFSPDFTQGDLDPTTYDVVFQATDEVDAGLFATSAPETFSVFNVNQAPTIEPVADQTVCAGASKTVEILASDADGETVDMWVDPLVTNMTFTFGAGLGTLVFEPTAAQIGSYPTTAYATDGSDTASTAFTINVIDCSAQDTGSVIWMPQPVFWIYGNAIDPLDAKLYVGDFLGGHTVDQVIGSSVVIDGSIVPTNIEVLPNFPGFTGEVLEVTFELNDFLHPLGLFFDTVFVPYSVTGEFDDGASFVIGDEVMTRGRTTGDANADGRVNLSDMTAVLDYMFRGAPEPVALVAGDVDGICGLNLSDIVHYVDFFFRGGEELKPGCSDQ